MHLCFLSSVVRAIGRPCGEENLGICWLARTHGIDRRFIRRAIEDLRGVHLVMNLGVGRCACAVAQERKRCRDRRERVKRVWESARASGKQFSRAVPATCSNAMHESTTGTRFFITSMADLDLAQSAETTEHGRKQLPCANSSIAGQWRLERTITFTRYNWPMPLHRPLCSPAPLSSAERQDCNSGCVDIR